MRQLEQWKLTVRDHAGNILLVRRDLPKEVALHRMERALAAGHKAEMKLESRRTRQKMGYVNSHHARRTAA